MKRPNFDMSAVRRPLVRVRWDGRWSLVAGTVTVPATATVSVSMTSDSDRGQETATAAAISGRNQQQRRSTASEAGDQ
jgi:hypothetical protein